MSSPVEGQGRPNITVNLTLANWDEWPEYDDPGKARIFDQNENRCCLQFCCPGCGEFGSILVGYGDKPPSPSWILESGDRNDPRTWTLSPSILCKGCCQWHGYLIKGVFRSC